MGGGESERGKMTELVRRKVKRGREGEKRKLKA